MKTKRNQGFTLVELLVVIAIIGILASLLLPVLSRAKERALRAKCLSNIKQVDLWFLSYGQDNGDRLPKLDNTSTSEPFTVPASVVDALTRDHFDPRVLYDPALHFENPSPGNGNSFILGNGPDYYAWYWYGVPSNYPYRWIGYDLALSGTTSVMPTNQNVSIIPQPIDFSGLLLPAPDTSRRLLAAGIVISASGQNNPALRNTYNYALKNYNALVPPYRTAHLSQVGSYPSGDNVAMMDGSAKWRKFQDMTPRTAPGEVFVFWW